MYQQGEPPVELGCAPVEDMLPEAMLGFYRHWKAKAGQRLPARGDMRIGELAAFLPNLVFVAPNSQPENFHFRLVGTEVVRKSRRDMTGLMFSDIDSMGQTSTFWRRYAWVRDTGCPLFATVEYVGVDDSIRHCQDLILPLSSDGEAPDSIVTFVNYIGRVAP